MKKFSKIFCLILAVALICTGLIMVVNADESTYDLASAVTGAEAEGTVALTGNAQIDSAITVDKDLTLDLGGYTINSTAEVLFEVKGDVTFTIAGTGAINVDGMVFRTESGKAPSVTVEGTAGTTGIDINHTGSKSENISYTYTGTYLYKNLDINTTFVGDSIEPGKYHAFLKNHSNINAAATFVTLDSVEFHANNVRSRNHGIVIVSLAGTGSKLTIKNSGLYTTGSGIELAYAKAVDANGNGSINSELAYVENSIISCVSPYISEADEDRNFGLLLDTWSGTQTYGTFTLKNSLLESTCRVIFANDAANIKVQVNAVNSIIRNVRERDDDNAQLIERHVKINLDKDSRIAAIKGDKNNGPSFSEAGNIKASVGTRINTLLATNITRGIYFPDGTYASGGAYKWVYDPITDPEFPYVCVEATDTSAVTPLYTNHFTFDNIRFTKDVDYKLGAANAKVLQDGATVHYDEENLLHRGTATTLINTNKMQWDVKMGSLYYGPSAVTSNYVKYVVTNDVISDKDKTVSGNTIKTDAAPYLIVGGGFGYANNLAHVKASGSYQRTKLAVLNFDFGTDSEFGYPIIDAATQTRYGTSDAPCGFDAFSIANDGKLTNKLQDKQAAELNAIGEWNHMTVVYYTDTTQGAAYYFLNGKYMGYSYLYNSGEDAYIMGIRFNIAAKTNQRLNSALCFDNISLVAYAEYLNGEEDGATSKTTAANYVTAAPANTFIKPELNKYNVNGISTFESFSDAVALAKKSGTVVELMDDYAASAEANGSVLAGDYEFDVDADSYGFVKEGDKYTFNETYKYDTKWYIGEVGSVEGMLDDANYVTTTVKLGHVADKAAIWTDETPNWNSFTVFTQNGWAYEQDSASSVTPFIPTLADLATAKEDGSVMYPSFGAVDMASYLKDANGYVAYYMDDTATTNAYHALTNGQTLVLNKDLNATKANALFHNTGDTPVVLGLDLNGHKFIYRHGGAVAWVGNNTTLNVYSSQPGGHISSYYYETSTFAPNSQRMFAISPIVNEEGDSYVSQCDNAHLNIGTFGNIPGSNMKISGGVLLEGINGNENCSINMDGVIAECVRPTSSGIIMTRYYNGDIIATNSIFVTDGNKHLIDIKEYKSSSLYYTPTVTIDGCSIMTPSRIGSGDVNVINGPGAVAEGVDHDTIVINNLISTQRVNPTGTPALINRGNNVTAYKVEVGSNVYTYNVPITFEALGIPAELVANGYYEFTRPVLVGFEIVEETIYVVENGNRANAPAGATVVELYSVFHQKATTDVVNVSWKNFDGSDARVEKFAKGAIYGNATSLEVDDYALNALKLVHNGNWNNIPAPGTVLTEGLTVTPGYTTEATVSGLKANLSLYSDFLVNLYIPENYAQYITAVNEKALAEGTVNFGDAAEFVKATVAKNANEASADAVFEIAIKEGNYTATKTVSISITDYASKILAGEQFANTDKALMYYMLNYANEVAKYPDGSADAEIAALLETYVQWNVVDVAKNFGNAVADKGLDSVFSYAGITLEAAPAFTFTPNGKFTGTVTVTYGDGNVREYTVPENSEAKILVEGMKIYNFATNITVTAVGTIADVNGEQTVTGTINLDTYAKYHTDDAANDESATKAESAAALDLINALYDYVKVAEQYKAGTLKIPTVNDGGEATPEHAPAE